MDTIQILKSLSDETRIRIVSVLREGALCVCEIESILNISQSNASRHLNKLMSSKIVTYYKEAKFVYYKLNDTTLSNFTFIDTLLNEFLENEEVLKKDRSILLKYKEQGLNCDSVSQIRDIILKINEK